MNRKKIAVLTGAGISAESGISTFRDAGGLWEGHDVMEVASYDGWLRNPELVLDFYNKRRKQLGQVQPNKAHTLLVDLENHHDVSIITQNVDDLHERAGSTHVIHLHGELKKVRSTKNEDLIYHWDGEIFLGDLCEKGAQLRPHIVWFGEMVPLIEKAAEIISSCEVLLIIGTSLQVYPAAGLSDYAPEGAEIYYVDPNPGKLYNVTENRIRVFPLKATEGMQIIYQNLTQ
jgi:NAD-dependent deacetylase